MQVFENLRNKLSEKKAEPDTTETADSDVIPTESVEQTANSTHQAQEVSKASEEERNETEDNATKEPERKVTGSVVLESKLNPSVPEFKLSASAPVFQPSAKAPAFEPSSESQTPKADSTYSSSPAETRLVFCSLFIRCDTTIHDGLIEQLHRQLVGRIIVMCTRTVEGS